MYDYPERPAFGPSARLHHVGIAVPSILAVDPALEPVHDPVQRVRVAFIRQHDVVLELIEPAGEGSPVQQSLSKGVKMLHCCYEVDGLESAIAAGREHGYLLLRPPVPAVAFGNRRIAWVLNQQLGLVELLERRNESA
jgi:methylmalonyl-CoA/ethylmalonyl-CoA epimerase